jgi:hypothetical protein
MIIPFCFFPVAGMSHPVRFVPSEEVNLTVENGILYAAGVIVWRWRFGQTVIHAIPAPEPIQKPKSNAGYAMSRRLIDFHLGLPEGPRVASAVATL